MVTIKTLEPYEDEHGNRIEYDGPPVKKDVSIEFVGSNNVLKVGNPVKVAQLSIKFSANNSVVDIAAATKTQTGLRFGIRIGQGSRVSIGSNVGSASKAFVRASEGASVTIGDECMMASSIEIRTDDTHAIYDVETGLRTNQAKDITIGEHVWIGKYAAILGGVTVGSGSVIGFRSIVTKDVPNNAIVAGTPARVVRTNIAWERPDLDKNEPDTREMPADQHRSERYWNPTKDDKPKVVTQPRPNKLVRAKRRLGRFLAR